MYLLTGKLENENRMRVELYYNLDVPENQDKTTADGVVVEEVLPYPPAQRGKSFVRYVNPVTKEQWFEAIDRPLNQDELAEIQKEIIAEQNEKIDLIMMALLEQEGIL